MNFSSPWGKTLEIEELGDKIYYLSTAIHGGLAVHLSLTGSLSSAATDSSIKINDYLFFEKDLAIHYPNIELDLRLFSKTESLSVILKADTTYRNKGITEEEYLVAKEKNIKEYQEQETAFLGENLDYITTITELDEGWKATTIEDREYLISEHPESKLISQLPVLGEITNFYKIAPKIIPEEILPSFVLEKLATEANKQVIAQPSKVKNSYILELYSVLPPNYIGDYLGEVNLLQFPNLIRWWCDE
jgi:hypothetical protein